MVDEENDELEVESFALTDGEQIFALFDELLEKLASKKEEVGVSDLGRQISILRTEVEKAFAYFLYMYDFDKEIEDETN